MVKFNIYPNGNSFLVSYTGLDKVRVRKTFKTQKLAKKFIEQTSALIEQEMAREVLKISPAAPVLQKGEIQAIKISDAIRKFVEFKKERTNDDLNLKLNKLNFKYIYNWFFDNEVDFVHQITLEHIEKMQSDWSKKGLAPATINRRIKGNLGPLLEKCVKWKYCTENPVKDSEALKVNSARRPNWTDQQIQLVMEKLEPWAQVFFVALAEFGARPKELCRLQWQDVDFDRNVLLLWSLKGKDSIRRERRIPLSEGQRKMLWDLYQKSRLKFKHQKTDLVFLNAKDKPVTTTHFGKVVRKVRNSLGFREVTPYGLRHSLLSYLAEMNVSTAKLQAFAGHSKSETTLKYYVHISDRGLTNVVDLVAAKKNATAGGDI